MPRRLLFLGLALLVSRIGWAAPPSEAEMAARIDTHLATVWASAGVTPAPAASDAEFLRRAWLDLCGIVPPILHGDGITGIRNFLGDTEPNKRQRLIRALLAKPRHAAHFATVWKNVMIPADTNVQRFGGDNGFQGWLRGQFADNVPYNKMVNDLLLATGNANQVSPALFYSALQLKPEELAASTSKIFLGTQIQCAQCHDHPFDHWTRNDFWGYAAFFARLARPQNAQQVTTQVTDTNTGELKFPETEDTVTPKFLGGKPSPDGDDGNRRQRLAQWLTSGSNPYFAQATVNRVWKQLFGRGIVNPADDLGKHNPPSHPELLNDLAQYFAETGFDLQRLIRTMAITQAYQLSSSSSPGDDQRPEIFARMAIKSLTAEQLYDCLLEAMRKREGNQLTNQRGGFAVNGGQLRQTFLLKFRAPTQGATEYEAGIPQALTLMNGSLIRDATDLQQSDILVMLDAPFFSSNAARLETLFMSTLSRKPSETERVKFLNYVEEASKKFSRRQALSDVLWALLNSAEFVLNH